ncbi:Succinate--hydroxymethylglutarate CoA-transferase [Fulvia fulva]|uniref:Succinate--hydroxymethylglutarate CoA-transferase n=1 Tax=Passalora fulva TaxID=5499 RepID=A0A9Q8PAF4_PASFU|nr:Succinate--hydroxymethylglutarate CoA-transferase [Fulvia fulva]KAK4621814.1 Succinate--hydroxymethylglutarate CoA-transferase [Fulvia fulva]KAK4622397.1 Succinate--hydroxymethylglutarate CoA-transferase [Fulvia fulva]UJO18826.1 Succinate--hydroxymethylglutarate CoA-transferase [Fulvia fulva]WPV16183.1 Succinate--hydroxymethylglutarate CoA-transferase [Fulvia fulva]WPV31609.1 Succinate--hydroxymethylglutarate CoA-transferase [Fulvia fulva]
MTIRNVLLRVSQSRREPRPLWSIVAPIGGVQENNHQPAFKRHFTGKQAEGQERGALAGVKILDLSRVLAAPYCTQILADYGADVIKIEDPERGDDTRYWQVSGESSAWNDDAGPISNYFSAVNRNKRSLTLNLKNTKARDIFLRLVEQADVVVENLRPGALDRLNLGYDVLSETNPGIILASTSGYGSSGPYAQRAGYDMIAGAEAGLLHLTGERGGKPVRPGLGLTDMCTGLYMHGAITAALYARTRTGVGQKIDGSLFETQVALLTNVGLSWLNLGIEAERWGTQHPSVVPYDAFQTKDLYFVCGATNDKQFAKLVETLGRLELSTDERFNTNPHRVSNREALFSILNELFRAKTTAEWEQQFEGSGLPYAPINTMERVFEHPQIVARQMVEELPFDAAATGAIKVIGPAIKFSKTPASIRTRPPLHGEHTTEILDELGIDEAAVAALKKDGAF